MLGRHERLGHSRTLKCGCVGRGRGGGARPRTAEIWRSIPPPFVGWKWLPVGKFLRYSEAVVAGSWADPNPAKATLYSRDPLTLEVQGTARSKLSCTLLVLGHYGRHRSFWAPSKVCDVRHIDTKLLPDAPQLSLTHSRRNLPCSLELRSAQVLFRVASNLLRNRAGESMANSRPRTLFPTAWHAPA